MTENPGEDNQNETSTEAEHDLDLSPAKGLFCGEIIQSCFWPFPEITDEQKEMLGMVLDSVDRFLEDKQDDFRQWDEAGEQPEEFIQGLRELGLFGLIIPEEHGGIGLSNTGYSRALQQSSRYDSSVSLTIGAHSSIGMKGLLLFGTDAQKEKYLPRLASGEMIAAYCLTESGSGSDAASIKTKGDQEFQWRLDAEWRKNLDHQRWHRGLSTRFSRVQTATPGKYRRSSSNATHPE